MATVKWSQRALDDLDGIAVFIARGSPDFVGVFVARVFQATRRLEQFPESGRVVPEFRREDVRELIFQNYRIVYRVWDGQIAVARVMHAAMDMSAAEFSDGYLG